MSASRAENGCSGVCPVNSISGVFPTKSDNSIGGVCPITGKDHGSNLKESRDHGEEKGKGPCVVPAKCPFGYDSNTSKLGLLSSTVCQTLLHESRKWNVYHALKTVHYVVPIQNSSSCSPIH